MNAYMKRMEAIPPITQQEEAEYRALIASDDQLTQEHGRACLVKAHLYLVISIAKEHMEQGMSFLQLVQEGNICLMKTAQTFRLSEAEVFADFVEPVIREHVQQTLQTKRNTPISH